MTLPLTLHNPANAIPVHSLWHPNHATLISTLTADLLTQTSPKTERRVLTTILPYILYQFASEVYAAENKDERKSTRVEAARAVLVGLNYSLCLEAHEIYEAPKNGKEIRCLLVCALAVLCQKIEGDKLHSLLTEDLPLSDFMTENAHGMLQVPVTSTLITTIVRSLLSLMQVPSSHSNRGEDSAIKISLRARKYLKELLASWQSLILTPDERDSGLPILEEFTSAMLKFLRYANRQSLNIPPQLQHGLYADLVELLPVTVHPTVPPNNIKILAHPLLLIRQCVIPIVRTCVWDESTATYGAAALNNIVAVLDKWVLSDNAFPGIGAKPDQEDRLTLSMSDMKNIVARAAKLASILSRYFGAARRLHTVSETLNPVILTEFIAKELVQWCSESCTTRMVQLFLIPILEQCLAIEENWLMGQRIVVRVYNGQRSADEADTFLPLNDNIDSTVQYFTKWLITTSCLRDVEEVEGNTESMRAAESLKAGKLPTPDGRMHLRNFCIKLLGMLPNANRQISLCLLSLFDDPSTRIRAAVSQAISMRCLNNLDTDSASKTANDLNYIQHRSDTNCTSKSPVGSRHLLMSYAHLLRAAQECCATQTEKTAHWQNSPIERQTFGLWCRYITAHIVSPCPLLKDMDVRKRIGAIKQFFSMIEEFLRVGARQNDVDMIAFKEIVCYFIEGVLGVWCEDARKELCDDEVFTPVLKHMLRMLGLLRDDQMWGVRAMCLEVCRMAMRGPVRNREMLLSVYRIINGNGDDVDAHPAVRELRRSILNEGEQLHPDVAKEIISGSKKEEDPTDVRVQDAKQPEQEVKQDRKNRSKRVKDGVSDCEAENVDITRRMQERHKVAKQSSARDQTIVGDNSTPQRQEVKDERPAADKRRMKERKTEAKQRRSKVAPINNHRQMAKDHSEPNYHQGESVKGKRVAEKGKDLKRHPHGGRETITGGDRRNDRNNECNTGPVGKAKPGPINFRRKKNMAAPYTSAEDDGTPDSSDRGRETASEKNGESSGKTAVKNPWGKSAGSTENKGRMKAVPDSIVAETDVGAGKRRTPPAAQHRTAQEHETFTAHKVRKKSGDIERGKITKPPEHQRPRDRKVHAQRNDSQAPPQKEARLRPDRSDKVDKEHTHNKVERRQSDETTDDLELIHDFYEHLKDREVEDAIAIRKLAGTNAVTPRLPIARNSEREMGARQNDMTPRAKYSGPIRDNEATVTSSPSTGGAHAYLEQAFEAITGTPFKANNANVAGKDEEKEGEPSKLDKATPQTTALPTVPLGSEPPTPDFTEVDRKMEEEIRRLEGKFGSMQVPITFSRTQNSFGPIVTGMDDMSFNISGQTGRAAKSIEPAPQDRQDDDDNDAAQGMLNIMEIRSEDGDGPSRLTTPARRNSERGNEDMDSFASGQISPIDARSDDESPMGSGYSPSISDSSELDTGREVHLDIAMNRAIAKDLEPPAIIADDVGDDGNMDAAMSLDEILSNVDEGDADLDRFMGGLLANVAKATEGDRDTSETRFSQAQGPSNKALSDTSATKGQAKILAKDHDESSLYDEEMDAQEQGTRELRNSAVKRLSTSSTMAAVMRLSTSPKAVHKPSSRRTSTGERRSVPPENTPPTRNVNNRVELRRTSEGRDSTGAKLNKSKSAARSSPITNPSSRRSSTGTRSNVPQADMISNKDISITNEKDARTSNMKRSKSASSITVSRSNRASLGRTSTMQNDEKGSAGNIAIEREDEGTQWDPDHFQQPAMHESPPARLVRDGTFSTSSLHFPAGHHPTPAFLRPRLRRAIERVLKGLVFSRDVEAIVVYGPVPDSDTNGESDTDAEAARHQGLHPLNPLLKKVFQLDATLLLSLCSTLDMSAFTTQRPNITKWNEALTTVHTHLAPVSKILWDLEEELGEELEVAQGLVIVRDQVVVGNLVYKGGEEAAIADGSLRGVATEGSFLRWIEDGSF